MEKKNENLAWKFILLIIVSLALLSTGDAQTRLHPEKYYQEYFAKQLHGSQTESTLDGRTRVGILTNTLAIECDFADKWRESIGQSLYYGMKTDRKPCVMLIMEDYERDLKYLTRLLKVANKYHILVFAIHADLKWYIY